MKRTLTTVLLCLATITSYAPPPAWWNDPETRILEPNAPENNAGPVVLGQLKHVATQAKKHLDLKLPTNGGAGPVLDNLVLSFADNPATNLSPINLGQLKAVAKPFYDRLLEIGYDTKLNLIVHGYPDTWTFNYPWGPSTPASLNYSPVTIGQLKLVFSFDLSDSDDDGMLDYWEMSRGRRTRAGAPSGGD